MTTAPDSQIVTHRPAIRPGLRVAAPTSDDVQHRKDGKGRITVIRSKTDVPGHSAAVVITAAAMGAPYAIRPSGLFNGEKGFGWSETQVARAGKVIAEAVELANREVFSGDNRRVGMNTRLASTARPPARSNAKAAGNRESTSSVASPAAKPAYSQRRTRYYPV